MAIPQQPQDPNATINRRFDLLRQRQEQAGKAAKQTAQEDIQRQAASRGRLGSGITQKQNLLAQEQIDKQQSANLADVESGREQALFQQAEADTNRRFAREERLGSQDFAAQQAQKQMEFQTSERLGAQGFNQAQFDANMAWQNKVFREQNKQFASNQKLQKAMFDRQMTLDEENSAFNRMMAEKSFNKPELMDFFFKGAGIDPKTGEENPMGILTGQGSFNPLDRRAGKASGDAASGGYGNGGYGRVGTSTRGRTY